MDTKSKKKNISFSTTKMVRVVIGGDASRGPRSSILSVCAALGALLICALYLFIPLAVLLHATNTWLFSCIGAAAFLSLVEAFVIITLIRIDSVEQARSTLLAGETAQPTRHDAEIVAAVIAPRLRLPARRGG